MPSAGGEQSWGIVWRDVNQSFWEMGLEFARRLDEAALLSPDVFLGNFTNGSQAGHRSELQVREKSPIPRNKEPCVSPKETY